MGGTLLWGAPLPYLVRQSLHMSHKKSVYSYCLVSKVKTFSTGCLSVLCGFPCTCLAQPSIRRFDTAVKNASKYIRQERTNNPIKMKTPTRTKASPNTTVNANSNGREPHAKSSQRAKKLAQRKTSRRRRALIRTPFGAKRPRLLICRQPTFRNAPESLVALNRMLASSAMGLFLLA